jgi:hypothetical protein
MKEIIKISAFLAVLAVMGCTDLETTPRQSLTPEQALNNVFGYQAVANSM